MFALTRFDGRVIDGRVVVWSDSFVGVVMLVAVVWWFALAARARSRHLLSWLPIAIAGWLVGMSFLGWVPLYLLDWRVSSEVAGPDGSTYVALYYGFMDHDYAVARRRWNCGFVAAYDVFAVGYRGHPILRPAGLRTDGGLVVHGGIVAYFEPGDVCRCVAAADFDGRSLVSAHTPAWRTDVETSRPSLFFFVGPEEAVEKSDVEPLAASIERSIRERGDVDDSLPDDAALVDALASTNPSVRETAAQLVRAGNERIYRKATTLLR